MGTIELINHLLFSSHYHYIEISIAIQVLMDCDLRWQETQANVSEL